MISVRKSVEILCYVHFCRCVMPFLFFLLCHAHASLFSVLSILKNAMSSQTLCSVHTAFCFVVSSFCDVHTSLCYEAAILKTARHYVAQVIARQHQVVQVS